MPIATPSHPDRAAATLANVAAVAAGRTAPFCAPSTGADDCRIDLKLLVWRARQAMVRSAAARAHLAPFAVEAHPDLWAGTVQDGVARGFASRLEEAIALAGAEPAPVAGAAAATTEANARVTTGKELRRRKDLLVKSGGARVRFTRKEGLLFVDRDDGLHSANCLRFEARDDRGTLDCFVPGDDRPRLFSAQFLAPVRYIEGQDHQELVLAGRLGRGANGFGCRLTLRGDAAATTVELRLTIDNRQLDTRLRARFLGLPMAVIHHDCTPVSEAVDGDHGGFVACTLLRANGRLLVDGHPIVVPGAQCQGVIEHVFRLGSTPS
ncbi:MAG: hypothetical protein K8J09_20050 [Planctomycetes bacterium]|nr:hypothetical protein [Planctomycetota bacterium]MCC7399767.1 hypothetical protein [Planctomycetota bacterium]